MNGVLVIAAHPDDAELAVGGTIARLTEGGVPVDVAFATVSEHAAERRHLRVEAAVRAAEILGHRLHWLREGSFDQVEDIPEYELVGLVDGLVERTRPRAVLSHWDGDSHGDHVRLARAVVASSRRWQGTTLCQFGANEHRTHRFAEFAPNLFVPMAGQFERKLKALEAYCYEGQGFSPLDLEWVRLHAASCGARAGVPFAEALRLVRHRADDVMGLFGDTTTTETDSITDGV